MSSAASPKAELALAAECMPRSPILRGGTIAHAEDRVVIGYRRTFRSEGEAEQSGRRGRDLIRTTCANRPYAAEWGNIPGAPRQTPTADPRLVDDDDGVS